MLKHSWLVALVAVCWVACSSDRLPTPVASGCTKDTDCKGDRICQAGQCVTLGDGGTTDALDSGSTSSNSGSDDDAGNPFEPDAGSTGNHTGNDAGMTTVPDAGTPPPADPNGIGAQCTDSSMQAQSTCSRGFNCIQLSTGTNMCTKLSCTSDSDCGTTSGIQNVCTGGSNAFCLRGCNPNAFNPCGRSDFACITDSSSGTPVSFCIPDCRVADYCTYPESCNQGTGDCSGSPACNTNTDCSGGRVCTTDSNGTKVCVNDCTAFGNSCPEGFQCNTSTRVCDPVQRTAYQTCGTGYGQCISSDTCVGFTTTAAICMQNCMADTDCPTGSTCNVDLNGGQKVCGQTCTGMTDMSCPAGTQCLYQGSDKKDFCGPPQQ